MWHKVKKIFEEWRYQSFYFTFYAGYMPLLLYLPVYLKHIGLNSIHVGILNGIRPILQSLVTPLLIALAEKFRMKKVLFVVSCVVAIAKVLVMFLLIKPEEQLCSINYVNKSNGIVWQVDEIVQVSLLESDNLPKQEHILNRRITKRDLNETVRSITTYMELGSDENSDSINEIGKKLTNNGTKFKRTLIQGYPPSEVSNRAVSPRNKNKIEDNHKRIEFRIIYNKGVLNRVFAALAFLTLFADPFIAGIFALVDYSCAANSAMHRGYKEVRVWETIGWGTMTPILGLVIYELGRVMCGYIVETFHYMFFSFIAFTTIALAIGTQVDFTQKTPEIISKKVHSPHSNLQYGMFSIISAFAGFSHGFLFTFVNWFIDSLGGTTVIMGIATTTKSIVDIIMYLSLGVLIEKLGHVAIITIGLVGHSLVFVAYFGITNAWFVILAEALYAVMYGSLMSTAASFLVKTAPAGSSTRLQAIFHGVYWGVGMTAGCILSGYRINTAGFSTTFLTFAVITAFVTVLFLAVQFHMFFQTDSKRKISQFFSMYSEREDLGETKLEMDNDDNNF